MIFSCPALCTAKPWHYAQNPRDVPTPESTQRSLGENINVLSQLALPYPVFNNSLVDMHPSFLQNLFSLLRINLKTP
jgi:hypothetical protein